MAKLANYLGDMPTSKKQKTPSAPSESEAIKTTPPVTDKPYFWNSLGGILTGLGALLTALVALYSALVSASQAKAKKVATVVQATAPPSLVPVLMDAVNSYVSITRDAKYSKDDTYVSSVSIGSAQSLIEQAIYCERRAHLIFYDNGHISFKSFRLEGQNDEAIVDATETASGYMIEPDGAHDRSWSYVDRPCEYFLLKTKSGWKVFSNVDMSDYK